MDISKTTIEEIRHELEFLYYQLGRQSTNSGAISIKIQGLENELVARRIKAIAGTREILPPAPARLENTLDAVNAITELHRMMNANIARQIWGNVLGDHLWRKIEANKFQIPFTELDTVRLRELAEFITYKFKTLSGNKSEIENPKSEIA